MSERGRGVDPARLRVALAQANIPALVVVLHQLTGERRWLEPPYRPSRGRGMDDNADGGLPAEVQREIREASYAAILAWADGVPVAVPRPRGDRLVGLLAVAQGEPVPEEFEPMMADVLGFADPPSAGRVPGADRLRVAVIGAGVSGLLAAQRLRQLGAAVTVLEKNDDVGGTWLENRYPGAGVDTPSHLYSVSFFDRSWSTYFGRRNEVEGYLRDFADAHRLRPLVRFSTEVVAASWAEDRQAWTLNLSTGDRVVADVVVSAVGQLNRPKIPSIPGSGAFRGTVFHSAQWPDGVDLRGRRVAVVGNGASAMQIVPAIVDQVAQLTVFQRSPQWIAPNGDIFRQVDPHQHWLMDVVPFYRRWYRARLAWTFNDKVHRSLQIDPAWDAEGRSINAENDGHRRVFTRYLLTELEGRPDLVDKCLPRYPPFGKRMLLDNGWFAALRRDHVDLVTEPVESFTPTGVRSRSSAVDADVVILCTGFEAHAFLAPMRVTGRSGVPLAEQWGADDATAYLGITVPDFPNLFLLLGPNTALGHGGSMITIAELQVGYVVALVERLVRHRLGAVEVRPQVAEEYNRRVDAAHARMIWTHPAMTNWYRNTAGRVVNTLPWRIVDYRAMVHEPDPADFLETPLREGLRPSA